MVAISRETRDRTCDSHKCNRCRSELLKRVRNGTRRPRGGTARDCKEIGTSDVPAHAGGELNHGCGHHELARPLLSEQVSVTQLATSETSRDERPDERLAVSRADERRFHLGSFLEF